MKKKKSLWDEDNPETEISINHKKKYMVMGNSGSSASP